MTEHAPCCGSPQGRVGLRRRGLGLVRGARHGLATALAALDLAMPGPGRAVGRAAARRRWPRRGRRDGDRRQGAPPAAAGRAGRRPRPAPTDGAAPVPAPGTTRRAAARRRGGIVGAAAQRERRGRCCRSNRPSVRRVAMIGPERDLARHPGRRQRGRDRRSPCPPRRRRCAAALAGQAEVTVAPGCQTGRRCPSRPRIAARPGHRASRAAAGVPRPRRRPAGRRAPHVNGAGLVGPDSSGHRLGPARQHHG